MARGLPANTNVLAMHRWLLEHTNLRHAGGYTTNVARSWHPVFEDVWLQGFGLSIFDASTIQTGGGGPRSVADGERDARGVRDHARAVIPSFSRGVVYIDNEDNSAAFGNLLDYYRGLFLWLEQQKPDQVGIRPGLYVKLWWALPLLAEFPYLYLCDVQYNRGALLPGVHGDWDDVSNPQNPFNVTFDPVSVSQTATGIQLLPSRKSALPAPATARQGRMSPAAQGRRGPTRDWFAWPSIYQFEGSNRTAPAAGPQTVTLGGATRTINFRGNWGVDYESTLVDDPAFPSVSPRLTLSPGSPSFLARLDRVVPPPDEPRQARRTIALFSPSGRDGSFDSLPDPTDPPRPSGNVSAGSRAGWLRSPNQVVLVTPRRVGFDLRLETHRLEAGAFKPVAASIATAPPGRRLPAHAPWAAAARTGTDAHVFVAAEDGTLLTSRAAPAATAWPNLAVQAERIVHQYSQLVVCTRGGWSVDAFFIGADRALHTSWWNEGSTWPSGTNQPIGNPEALLPTSNLAALSPDPTTILVFGVGFDLHLHLARWSSPGPWVGPTPIGGDDELLAAHGDIAAAWNPARLTCEVLAVTNDLGLCLYQFSSTGTSWVATGPRFPVFTPDVTTPVSPSAANPFGDVAMSLGTRRVIAAVFAEPASSVAKWRSSDVGLDPGVAPWSGWNSL